MNWWHALQHWLAVHTGTVNESGPYYGFWSGFGSDIGEVAIIGGVIQLYRKHNCHVRGCLRIAHHEYTMGGVVYHLCRKHHPATPNELQHAETFLEHHLSQQEGTSDAHADLGHRNFT